MISLLWHDIIFAMLDDDSCFFLFVSSNMAARDIWISFENNWSGARFLKHPVTYIVTGRNHIFKSKSQEE